MTWLRDRIAWFRAADLRLQAELFGVGLLVMFFVWLGDEMIEGDTHAIDNAILMAFRNTPDDPIGSYKVEAAVMHISALGSGVIAALIVTIVAAYLILARRFRYALTVIAVGLGTGLVMSVLKPLYDRERPTVVTHIDPPGGLSFPSGHSMISAALYLTLGMMIARSLEHRRLRVFAVGTGAFLAFLIGFSRVYLGVHYPSDVVAGWTVGGAWALLVGITTRRFRREVEATPDETQRAEPAAPSNR
jgi:undecaprenyl-diphosphatase